jgi:membrane protein YdbS with pleckstrin-like domain
MEINLGSIQKLGPKALWYKQVSSAITIIILALILLFFDRWLELIPFILLVVIWVYNYFWWKKFEYTVFKDHIITKVGIIFQTEKSLNYNDFQSVEGKTGPLLNLFGLEQINGFTSSPQQIVISSTKNGTRTKHIPDLQILLEKDYAKQILTLIPKGDVQKVQNIN